MHLVFDVQSGKSRLSAFLPSTGLYYTKIFKQYEDTPWTAILISAYLFYSKKSKSYIEPMFPMKGRRMRTCFLTGHPI